MSQGLEEELRQVSAKLGKVQAERQWVITQARKGRISEEDMDLQLEQLRLTEHDLRIVASAYEALLVAREQTNAVVDWSSEYLGSLLLGMSALDVDVEDLPLNQFDTLYDELGAFKYENRYPGDRTAQLKWAILEEKRRIVRVLIEKVVVGKGPNGQGRSITPILAFSIPADPMEVLASRHQSLEFINTRRNEVQAILA